MIRRTRTFVVDDDDDEVVVDDVDEIDGNAASYEVAAAARACMRS
jgi:hypothetical protein